MPRPIRWLVEFPRRHPLLMALAGFYMFWESAWSGISTEPFFIWVLQHGPLAIPRFPVPDWAGAFFNQTLSAVVGGLLVAIALQVLRGTARLIVEFEDAVPYVLSRPPNTFRYTAAVRNRGPSVANNVEVSLEGIAPPLRRGPFWGDYPYPVAVNRGNWEYGHLYDVGRTISSGNQESFLLFTATKVADDEFTLKGINSKSRYERGPGLIHENEVYIRDGEDWILSYRATAANARPRDFKFRISVTGGELAVARVDS